MGFQIKCSNEELEERVIGIIYNKPKAKFKTPKERFENIRGKLENEIKESTTMKRLQFKERLRELELTANTLGFMLCYDIVKSGGDYLYSVGINNGETNRIFSGIITSNTVTNDLTNGIEAFFWGYDCKYNKDLINDK